MIAERPSSSESRRCGRCRPRAAARARVDAPTGWRAIDFISDLHLARGHAAHLRRLGSAPARHRRRCGVHPRRPVRGLGRRRSRHERLRSALRRRAGRGGARSARVASWPATATSWSAQRCCGDCGVACPARPDACSSPSASALLLTHGDALCLADIDYQRFAPRCAADAWQRELPGHGRWPSGARSRARLRDASAARKRRTAARRLGRRRRRRRAALAARGRRADADPRPHPSPGSERARAGLRAPRAERLGPRPRRHAPRARCCAGSATACARIAPARRAERADAGRLRWQRWREARALRRRAIPDALWQLTLARFPFLAARSADDARRRCATGDAVPRRKEFTGAQRPRGHRRRWRSRSRRRPACRCCELGLRLLRRLRRHRRASRRGGRARARSMDEDGVVHATTRCSSGEAMDGGPVMLSWRDVAERRRVGASAATTS